MLWLAPGGGHAYGGCASLGNARCGSPVRLRKAVHHQWHLCCCYRDGHIFNLVTIFLERWYPALVFAYLTRQPVSPRAFQG
jgi:hypothetical protein